MSAYSPRIYNPQSKAADTDAMWLRMRAQSLLVVNGRAPELPTYDEAVKIIATHETAKLELV